VKPITPEIPAAESPEERVLRAARLAFESAHSECREDFEVEAALEIAQRLHIAVCRSARAIAGGAVRSSAREVA
jgi:hypothetical protein